MDCDSPFFVHTLVFAGVPGRSRGGHLKDEILEGKDPNGKLYYFTILLSRLFFFLLFVFLEANFLPQWAPYDPASLVVLLFVLIQSILVMDRLDLALDWDSFESVFGKCSELRFFAIFCLFFSLVLFLAFGAFLLGLLALTVDIIREVSTTIFITIMLSTMLWAFLKFMRWIAGHMGPARS